MAPLMQCRIGLLFIFVQTCLQQEHLVRCGFPCDFTVAEFAEHAALLPISVTGIIIAFFVWAGLVMKRPCRPKNL
jgi:hypothetical protein